MDTSEFDKQIEEINIKIDHHREKMIPIYDDFLKETTIVLSDYYKKKTEEFVVSKPDITQRHGKEGITNLKSDCRELLKRVPELINKNLGINKFWSHKWDIDVLKTKYGPNHYNSLFDMGLDINKSLTNSASNLRELLTQYGYIKEGKTSHYPGIGYIKCSKKMKTIFKKYIELDEEFYKLTSELSSVENEKERAKAKDIWNTS